MNTRTLRWLIPRAAAATIIIAAMIGLYSFTDSIDGATSEFAEMVEAVKKVPWMYFTCEQTQAGSTNSMEAWISFKSHIEIEVERVEGGKITFWDYGKGKKYEYQPASNTLTIPCLCAEDFALGTTGPLELFSKLIDIEKDRGATIVIRKAMFDGKEVEIYEVARSEKRGIEKSELIVELQRRLPVALEVAFTDHQGTAIFTVSGRFDYPENGPEDIYAVGVPRTAQVVNNMR